MDIKQAKKIKRSHDLGMINSVALQKKGSNRWFGVIHETDSKGKVLAALYKSTDKYNTSQEAITDMNLVIDTVCAMNLDDKELFEQ